MSGNFSPNNIKETDYIKSKATWSGLGFFLAFVFAMGTFVSGVYVGKGVLIFNHGEQAASVFSFFTNEEPVVQITDSRPNLDEFWEVWDLMEDKFAVSSSSKALSEEDRLTGAIEGLVASYGDPYTVYLPPSEATEFNENISGNFSGVGMEVGLQEGMITVIAPLTDTPAEKAGVLPGDVLVRIDDKSTEGMRIDEAVKLIRGEKGTVVNLKVYREGELEFVDIAITRDTINIPTIKTEQVGDTFIIALYSFNAVSDSQFQEALRKYTESKSKSLVVDLRGNPGGFLQSAVSISSYFLPANKIVVKEEFGDSSLNEEFKSSGRQIQNFEKKKLVVLVDNGSASASEILAGALKDHGVATVIGSQTFGKGSVQELVELEEGSSLKVTVARWLTPNGVSISDGGLTPDIIISRSPSQRLAGEDPQKEAAIKFLKGENVISESFENQVSEATTSTPE